MNKSDSVFALVIFLITFQFCFHPCNGFLPTKEFFLKHKWVNITNSLTSGATKGFFSDQELTDYLKNLKTNFPDLVNKLEPIGKTVEGKDIHTLVLTAQTPPTQEKKPRILFTGFLHGTDFMSTATLLHLTNYLIYGYLHKQPDTTYLLENREVWIVPAINLDAYSFVSNYVKSHNRTFLITKNRRQNDPTDICGEAIGVNLNRNFDINFDSLDVIPGIQNSYNPNSDEYRCKPYYRGEKPFSEPETAAIRDLLNKYTFEMGINLIGIGPKFILPQTFAEDTKTRAFYESIQTESPFPQGTPIGTRNVLSQEVFNGELTDYMFAKKNIISGSFMVGINEKGYEGNFPTIPKMQRLLRENLDSLLYFIYKAGENLKIEELKQSSCFIDQTQCTDEPKYASYYFQLKISNSGLKDFSKTPTILLSFSNEEVYTIEQIFLTTSSNERKQVYFTTSNDDHGRIIYHIEGNPLKKGEYFIITPVIIRTSSASLGKYSEIPSDGLQYLFASIQHYPTNQISHLKSQIKHPNFDIEEMESKRLAARKLMMTCVICLVSSLFIGLGGFVIVKCLKRQPRSQFKKLEDHSQDFEGQIEMTSSNRKNKHKEDFEEGEKQERQKRKSKDKTKKKRTGSNSQGKEKSPDEPKSKSREGSKEKRGSAKKKEISVAGSKKKYSQLNRHEDDIELQHRKAE